MAIIRPVELLAAYSHPSPKIPESWDYSQWVAALQKIEQDLMESLKFTRSQIEARPGEESELTKELCAASRSAIEALRIHRSMEEEIKGLRKKSPDCRANCENSANAARIRQTLRVKCDSLFGSLNSVFYLLGEEDLAGRLPNP